MVIVREMRNKRGYAVDGRPVRIGHTWLSDKGPVAVAADIVNGSYRRDGKWMVVAAAAYSARRGRECDDYRGNDAGVELNDRGVGAR